jgi:Zn-dependent peptidase ImmA (M78 family)
MTAMAEPALVTPALLKWARTSMRIELNEAARLAKVKAERLADWEAGTSHPSIPQARKLASLYKRPLAALYLPEPPSDFSVPHDFRRLPDLQVAPLSRRLVEAIRLAEYRRSTALELSDQTEGASDLVGIASMDDDPDALAERVRSMLGVTLASQRRWKDDYDAFNAWKSAVEARGVLVFHFSWVEVEEARAFSIVDDRFPVVDVNGKEKPYPRIFSLMHELCHVVLRRGGISDFHERDPEAADTRVEVYCNRFAGSLLVPAEALLGESLVMRATASSTWGDDELAELARYYAVSREVILRRLLILGKTSEAFYRNKRRELTTRQRTEDESEQGGFLAPPRNAIRAVGQPFARIVLGAYYEQSITLSDVSEYLGVRVKHLKAIEGLLRGPNLLTGGDR